MEPEHLQRAQHATPGRSAVWGLVVALAVLAGLALLVDASFSSSATYDEVAYLRVAARWWRTGDQSEITRMGSPLTFWKLQQVPVLWLLDHVGRRDWIDDPIGNQRALLPAVRLGSLWIWLVALVMTAAWSRRCHGSRAMALAAWLFALSPNLIAHGALATMELPLVAGTTAMFWFFWRFLESDHRRWFWAAAAVGGLAFSCKYTTILVPPILAVVWWASRFQKGVGTRCAQHPTGRSGNGFQKGAGNRCAQHPTGRSGNGSRPLFATEGHGGDRRIVALTREVALGMLGFLLVMLLANFVVTGFALIPLSTSRGHHPTIERWLGTTGTDLARRVYETPLPQDWVGFATQTHHQGTGGASYLCGERRLKGWWYYYLVALAVKVPLSFWVLVTARLALVRRGARDGAAKSHDDLLPLVILLYLAITAAGSSRNYGVRYLLPLAPLAIVWVSGLAESRGIISRAAVAAGLAGYVAAVVGIHPHELTYFNALAGGPIGGRHILSDSNLDWGQGLKSLCRLQQERPEFQDVTLYYFGDTEPAHYGVAGRCHVINAVDDHSHIPSLAAVKTPYLAVSASLEWGPWGPLGFFRILDQLEPIRLTDDTTIAIYRTADLHAVLEESHRTEGRAGVAH